MSDKASPDFVPVVPGSRSIAARALICASLVSGKSTILHPPVCDDTDAILACVAGLGADVLIIGPKTELSGPGQLNTTRVLDCNASGTTMRFISSLSILTDKELVLTGTHRLMQRPMAGLNKVLETLGKTVTETNGVRTISGTPIIPAEMTVDASSSGQFVSGLLMALAACGKATILRAKNPVSIPFITMTMQVMKSFGAQIEMQSDGDDMVFEIAGTGYKQTDFYVEPDIMSANYFLAATLITGKSVFVPRISKDTIQGDIAFAFALEKMGAKIEFIDGGIRAAGGGVIHGCTVDLAAMPDMSLTIAALAALADSPTTMTSARILKFKESDRTKVIVDELTKLGASVRVASDEDSITITPAASLPTAAIDTYEDHRVAMAFGLLTLINPAIVINDPECVAKTWPNFFSELARYKDFA